MNRRCLTNIIQATAITLTLTAICKELEKPKEKREWHGRVACFVPYDFRMPTWERIKETYWNPYDSRILTPEVFGVGWAINFYALLDRLRVIGRGCSEQDYLMPGEHMKDVLTHATEVE
jgi:hypothetical protein